LYAQKSCFYVSGTSLCITYIGIARGTRFNGRRIFDPLESVSCEHNDSELESTGKLKIHFGLGNDSAEDLYSDRRSHFRHVGRGADPLPSQQGIYESPQATAQRVLEGVKDAIVSKDKIRAHLGHTESSGKYVSNLQIQAESLKKGRAGVYSKPLNFGAPGRNRTPDRLLRRQR